MRSAKNSKGIKGPIVLHSSTHTRKIGRWDFTSCVLTVELPDGTYITGIKGEDEHWRKELFSRWNYNLLDGDRKSVMYEISQWPLTENDAMVLDMLSLSWMKDAVPYAMYKKNAKVRKK